MAVSKRQSEQEHEQGTVLFNSQVQAVSRNSRAPLARPSSDVLKVWPRREPIQRLPPAQFNRLLDQLVTRHCP
jgi:hypothetical protein